MVSPRFFFALLALLFCFNIVLATTDYEGEERKMISYGALGENVAYAKGPIPYGHRRLMALVAPSTGLTSATPSGNMIKAACQDNSLDYLGKMCSTVLQSAPISSNARSLAAHTLKETAKLVANTTTNAKSKLDGAGDVSPDVRTSIKSCANKLYVEAYHDINVAIFELVGKKSNVQYNLVTKSVLDASEKIRTCLFDLSSKRFLQGQSRIIVNEINGENLLIKKLLAAAWTLVLKANVKV